MQRSLCLLVGKCPQPMSKLLPLGSNRGLEPRCKTGAPPLETGSARTPGPCEPSYAPSREALPYVLQGKGTEDIQGHLCAREQRKHSRPWGRASWHAHPGRSFMVLRGLPGAGCHRHAPRGSKGAARTLQGGGTRAAGWGAPRGPRGQEGARLKIF